MCLPSIIDFEKQDLGTKFREGNVQIHVLDILRITKMYVKKYIYHKGAWEPLLPTRLEGLIFYSSWAIPHAIHFNSCKDHRAANRTTLDSASGCKSSTRKIYYRNLLWSKNADLKFSASKEEEDRKKLTTEQRPVETMPSTGDRGKATGTTNMYRGSYKIPQLECKQNRWRKCR